MRRPARTPPATPKVRSRATAALVLLGAEEALAVLAPGEEPPVVLEAVPTVVEVDIVEDESSVVVDSEAESVVVVEASVVLVVVEASVVLDSVDPDLEISNVSDWARIPVFMGSLERKLNLYLAPGVATKLVRVYLLSEVLTSASTVMGFMVLWSTRTSWKVFGSVDTEVHLTSMDLEKSSFWSLVGEVTRMAGESRSVLTLANCWNARSR
jgi:hypothetical protein